MREIPKFCVVQPIMGAEKPLSKSASLWIHEVFLSVQSHALCWFTVGKDDSCAPAVLDQDLSLMHMLPQALWADLLFGLVADPS